MSALSSRPARQQRSAAADNAGILRRSREILREAGALIIRCLRHVRAPGGRTFDPRAPRQVGGAMRRDLGVAGRYGATLRRRRMHGQTAKRIQPGRFAATPVAGGARHDRPSDATIAQLLRQHAFRIANSADPVDALAGVIDLVIDSGADPYHLIGVLTEGALQTLTHRIPPERQRNTAMALAELLNDRLQFARTE
jgi:hypothetical protein